jgi:hypothetical protein
MLADHLDQPVPWLAPYRELAGRVLAAADGTRPVAAALNAVAAARPVAHPAGRLCFVPQAALPAGEAYEAYIARTACVPTRDNLHDLFNGLVWLAWPAFKCRLNAWQAAELARQGVGARRGALRDALTVLDENGAVLHAPPPLVAALKARQWQRLLGELRPLWRDARLTLVGHALMEKLVRPYKAITAHVLVGGPDPLQALPEPGQLAAKPFLPLPVLGVPGWWPANEDPAFHADPRVFRPAPSADSTGAG